MLIIWKTANRGVKVKCVERNVGSGVLRNAYVGVFFMSESLSSDALCKKKKNPMLRGRP